ncbi:hypothetical protein J2X84_002968 [Pseudomonas corrugata]|uniref:KTSC domain-containing protein n=1 Tax=Pseudomonas corrugata TaxID=47879 RepID=UPI0028633E23|nr:KTSC domain-containing protein [Pseudomonas corrugata]MDR7284135.1 hypothetical protein [Pseudomonas corrugata]
MERRPVSSSNLASVGYDEANSLLHIEFNSGKIYEYHGVPESVYQDLINAGSPGGYFHSHVKNVFSCQEI